MTESTPMGRRFWAVWAGSSASFVAEGLLAGSMPLLAASLTRDSRLISVTDALTQAGWLLLGLASGVVADRLPRLGIMWVANAARALAAGLFTVVVATGHASMPLIYGLGFVLGLLTPFFDNASSAVLPELVAPEQFQRANSWTQISVAVGGNLLGPVSAAAVFVLTPAGPFALTTLAFATAAIITIVVARRQPERAIPATDASNSELLREGLAYLARHKTLLTLAIAVGISNLVTSGVVAILVLFVLQVLHLPRSAYGTIIGAFAGGALVGAVLSVRITRWLGERTSLLIANAMFGVAILVMAAVPIPAVTYTALAVTGVFAMVWNVTVNSYRQRVVPLPLLGRVTSVYRMLAFVAMPIGSLGAGFVAHALGLQGTYAAGGILLLLTTVAIVIPLRDMPNHPTPSGDSPGPDAGLPGTPPTDPLEL